MSEPVDQTQMWVRAVTLSLSDLETFQNLVLNFCAHRQLSSISSSTASPSPLDDRFILKSHPQSIHFLPALSQPTHNSLNLSELLPTHCLKPPSPDHSKVHSPVLPPPPLPHLQQLGLHRTLPEIDRFDLKIISFDRRGQLLNQSITYLRQPTQLFSF